MKTNPLELLKAMALLMLYMSPYLLLTWYIIYRWGKKDLAKEKAEYDVKYTMIKFYLKEWPMDDRAYERLLLGFIDELKSLPYRNREKTEILRKEILKRFEKSGEVQKGAPFDEPVFSPDCQKCGLMNSENCNTCNPYEPTADQIKKAEEKISAISN